MAAEGTDNQTVSPPPLPLWQPTFLARYSRNTKMAATTLLVFILASPWLLGGFHNTSKQHATEPKAATVVQGSESKAAIPNPVLSVKETPTAVPSASQILNNQDDHTIKMASAPDEGLSEDTAEGSLPRIGIDGREPWQVYARPFNTADTRPRIAIVVADLGLSRIDTDAAIARLPSNVTLAFDVQSHVVGAWCARARQAGHETLLMVPMEPFDYPHSDPGPNTLLTTLPNSDNIERLQWALRQASGYVGITTLSGSSFTTDPDKMKPVIEVLKKRGLMVLDARTAPHSIVGDVARAQPVPVATATLALDQNLAPEAIDAALDQLEQTARLTGRAIGITSPEPIMLDHIQEWLKGLPTRGIALAPVSAMTK